MAAMLKDPVRVVLDLRAFADSIVRGDGRQASENDAAALLRELGWTYDGHGWRGERRAAVWLRKLGPVAGEQTP
jgi:hypothetical protein